jgi:type II secretion system protein I
MMASTVATRAGGRADIESGFTLVEILVSLGILAMVLPALLLTFGNGSRSRAVSESRTTAAYLVRDTLSELQAAGVPTPGETQGVFEEGARFEWRTAVSPTETDGLFDVVATIVWSERGQEQALAVRTYMADPAIPDNTDGQQQGPPQGP